MPNVHSSLELVNNIRAGNIIAFPTDTVYALAVDAKNPDAIKRLRELKKRDKDQHFVVFVPGIDSMLEIVNPSKKQLGFISYFTPGDITFILPRKLPGDGYVDSRFMPHEEGLSKDGTIAVRCPNDEIPLQIIKEFNGSMFATSVNISGERFIVDPKSIAVDFPDVYVLMTIEFLGRILDFSDIDGGFYGARKPSAIVNLIGDKLNVVRSGSRYDEVLDDIWEQ